MLARYHLIFFASIWLVFPVAFSSWACGEEYDWSGWRGPDGNSISSESGWDPYALAGEPKVLWRINVGYGYSSVGVKGKYWYTMGYDDGEDTVYCVSVETGEEVWRYSYPCVAGSYAGPRATPVYSDSLVYTVSRKGQLHCFEAESGKVKWKKDLRTEANTEVPRWGISSSAVIDGEMLLLNVGQYGLALNKGTGDIIWASPKGVPGYASPVLYDLEGRRCMVCFGRDTAYGVAVKTGELLWRKRWFTRLEETSSDPVVWGHHVFISTIYSKGCTVFSIAGDECEEVWLNEKLVTKFSTSILFEGNLYGIHGNTGRGTLRCVDFMTGEVRWEEKFKFASAIVVDEKLVILDEKGMLYIARVHPDGYHELSRGQVLEAGESRREAKGKCWTAPVLCRGMIFCRNDRGDLVCVDVRK